jgi:hypothetical protein
MRKKRNRRNQNNRSNRSNRNNQNRLPLDVILQATSGNAEAINAVVRHYTGYIISFAKKQMIDEDGVPHCVIDSETHRTLETELILNVPKFDLARMI